MSKREALKQMAGQSKLLEIIDQAYDNAADCPNCKALADWWEQYGSAIPTPQVMPGGPKARTRRS